MSRTILICLVLLAAITPKINAQQSAQAVMKVSARVINSAAVTHHLPATVDLGKMQKKEIPSGIGRIKIRHARMSGVFIKSASRILLTNERGHQVPLYFDQVRRGNDGDEEIHYSAQKRDLDKKLEGRYSGEHTTVVEYI
ncbi:MAG: hypothetical protein R3211_02205 [Balneolaceae bacterium]|nr:hypothetical protein [Balneolaceae bacterium]